MRYLLLALLLTATPARAADEPLRVFVSVVPQQTFVERVGAERVTVRAMVKPGFSPHTYEPAPQQVSALSRADLYVRAGVPFESAWLERIRAVNPDMAVVAPPGEETGAHAPHATHAHQHHGEHDPHAWTDPLQARAMASAIRDALSRLDPAGSDHYASGYARLAAELEALDADIRALLEGLPSRRFMVYHPAWGHFAERYGLTQIAIQQEGKEPGARTLSGLIERARREGIGVIFIQPQMDDRLARRVADAIGARLEKVDPLAADYAANLRRVARLIAEANRP